VKKKDAKVLRDVLELCKHDKTNTKEDPCFVCMLADKERIKKCMICGVQFKGTRDMCCEKCAMVYRRKN